MRREPRGLDFAALVLLAAAIVAYLKGLDAALWTLVWVWAGVMALVALVVGVLASLRPGARVGVRFGPEGRPGKVTLALWGLFTAAAFAYLAVATGRFLFWVPVLSLAVVALPGSGTLLLDEYVQGLLARGASLAGGLGLGLLPLFALTGAPGLDVVLAALAVYAIGLEAYVAWSLRA